MSAGLPELESKNRRSQGAARVGKWSQRFPSIVISRDPADLSRITEPGVAAVLIERPELRSLLGRLPRQQGRLASARGERTLDLIPVALRAVIARDEQLIAELLQRTSGVATRRELLPVLGKECSKFHVDFQSLRALVTYLGPGTWLAPNEVVDAEFLCTGGDDVESANARIVTDPRAIVRAESGDVVLLKGADFVNGPAAVHRSPPQRFGSVRLLLKVTARASLRSQSGHRS